MATNLGTIGIIIAFIAAMVGIPFLMAIGDQVYGATETLDITDENISIAASRSAIDNQNFTPIAISLVEDYITALILFNETKEAKGILAEDTDYTVDYDAGTFIMLNTTKTLSFSNRTFANYTFRPGTYVKGSSASRTLIRLITLFFAIGVFLVVLGKILENTAVGEWMKGGIKG